MLFDTYYAQILNYAIKRTGDAAGAQDITAETFYKAMISIDKFNWQGISISNWFYKIATNEIRMYFRKNKYRPASLDLLFANGLEIADERDFLQEIVDAQDGLERQQEFLRAQQLLKTLPLKYQEVITLRFTEKKRLAEIATILGKKEGTLKSLLSRGLKKLKKELEQMQQNDQPDIIASEGREILLTQELYED